MTALPASGYLNDNARTEGEMKAALENILQRIKELPGGAARTQVAISSGSITPTTPVVQVSVESGSSDDLDTIAVTNFEEGSVLILYGTDGERIRIRHEQGGSGQISTASGDNFGMGSASVFLVVVLVGTTWKEVAPLRAPKGVYYASDWGVTADGTTDDQPALQALIDEGTSGKITVILPEGTVRIDDALDLATNNVNLALRGQGSSLSTGSIAAMTRLLAAPSGFGGTELIAVGDQVLVAHDLDLDANAVAGASVILMASSGRAFLTNVKIAQGAVDGVSVVAGATLRAMNCAFTSNGTAIDLDTTGIAILDNPYFSGNTTDIDDATTTGILVIHNPVGLNPPQYASAATLNVPRGLPLIEITGTTTITAITAGADRAGMIIALKFAAAATVQEGGTILLAGSGDFVATADDVLTLGCDGTNWYEVSRSVN